MNNKADYVLGLSGGNDSIALIQWAIDAGVRFVGLYNDTGWAADFWPERISEMSEKLDSVGSKLYVTESIGMEALVRGKKGWPMPASKMQFCTRFLKENPTTEWLSEYDPECEITFVTGIRREESVNRRNAPLRVTASEKHGGRELYSPLVSVLEDERNALIEKLGMKVLPHQSMECWPCVCANKGDLTALSKDPARIDMIEAIEIDMGHTRNDKPRTMFRPYRVGGGVGIRQAVAWGTGSRGFKSHFTPNDYKVKWLGQDLFEGISDIAYDEDTEAGREFSRQCSGGFCGN